MQRYKAVSQDSRTVELTENGEFVASLTYNSWLSSKATILLEDKSRFHLEPKGFWGLTIEIKGIDSFSMQVKLNWNSEEAQITNFGTNTREFVFKYTGNLINYSYSVTDDKNRAVVTVDLISKWCELSYKYDIATGAGFEDVENKELVLLMAVYLANYHLSVSQSAVIAAIS